MREPLNVLLVYYEPAPSGQTTHVLALARSLDPSRHRVTVVLPDRLERAIAEFKRADVERVGLRVVPLALCKVVWPVPTAIAAARLIRRERIDVVHIHSLEAGLSGRLIARIAGLRLPNAPRIVYTPQTIDIRQARWHRLYAWIERGLARLTDAVISVNGADRQRLIAWGIPAHKVTTIPNGIDLCAFDRPVDVRELCRSLALDADRPLVMQVARLSEQKNPLAFVEGAARAIAERPDVQFALVGEGPLREETRARIRALGLEHCVRLLGWREQAYRLLAAADVATLTSRWEGLPYSLLEAMAWSRPVVATAVNGCTEAVLDGESGYLVPPGDTTAWARRVLELLADPPMAAAFGRRGRERVEELYSLQAVVARTERLYRQVCRRSDARRAVGRIR